MTGPDEVRRTSLTGWKRALAAAAVGGVAAVAGLILVPAAQSAVGPAEVSLRVRAGAAQTALGVPPFGTVTAATHGFPLRVELTVTSVDVERLGRGLISEAGRERLSAQSQEDLTRLAVRGGIQFEAGAIVLALIAGALFFRHEPRAVATAAISGALFAGALFAGTAVTFRPQAFDEPRFTGSLTHAREVIEVFRRSSDVIDEARSRFEIASRRISDLLVLLGRPDPDPRSNDTAILHISDIHANPAGLTIAGELARAFDVDAIIDTGDLASSTLDTGEVSSLSDPVDLLLADEIRKLRRPYLYVAGNHDSGQLRRIMAATRGVVVLDGDVARVDELRILGIADPTFSTRPIPEAEKQEQRLAMAPEVAERVRRLEPHILAVHDERLASESLGEVLFVLAGHTHEGSLEEVDGTVVVTVGSSGATGLKSLTVEAERSYDAQVLYFEGSRLVALDYVQLTRLGGDFEISRETFTE